MECTSLKCIVIDCWWAIATGVGHFFAVVWPVLAVYGVLYAAGAAAFLINLRFKSGGSGRLEVRHDSWAYMLAHPYRYGQIKAAVEVFGTVEKAKKDSERIRRWLSSTSICFIYARLFNMLLLVWPLLLLWFGVACTTSGVFISLIVGAGYVKPNLSNDAFLEIVPFYDDLERDWQWYKAPFTYAAPVAVIAFAVFKWATFLRFVITTGKVLLCLAPIIAFIAFVVWSSRKVYREHDDSTTTVGALSEFAAARKEKFCKMVDIK